MHALRIDDELWSAAMAKAKSEGRTLTQVISDALAAYLAGPGATAGKRKRRAGTEAQQPVQVLVIDEEGREGIAFDAPGTQRGRTICAHPKARVIKGMCGACGTGGLK